MPKLRVKNCGPITEGLDSSGGFMDIGTYTLFIGDQGTGKSTVAKLVSICSWLEKALFRGDYDAESFNASDFKELYKNQLLSEAFGKDTEIEYVGDAYRFLYKDKSFKAKVNEKGKDNYFRPKIMYIPSERNVLSVVKNIDSSGSLPPMLSLLRKRYLQASAALNDSGTFAMPLSDYRMIVNKSNGETHIRKGKSGKKVPLICASSGLQSVAPSSLVTEYLSNQSLKRILEKIRSLPNSDFDFLKSEIPDDNIKVELERYATSGVEKSISEKSLPAIEAAARKVVNASFLNIVEEPEQNLFPDSQMRNIDFLVNATKRNIKNRLVLTTHSPYVLSYITLAAKAFELSVMGVDKKEIEKIIPRSSWLDGTSCIVYQIKDGRVSRLPSYGKGLPSDTNMLNNSLGTENEKFDELLDLEERFAG